MCDFIFFFQKKKRIIFKKKENYSKEGDYNNRKKGKLRHLGVFSEQGREPYRRGALLSKTCDLILKHSGVYFLITKFQIVGFLLFDKKKKKIHFLKKFIKYLKFPLESLPQSIV
jgi:hypothetical protein